MDSGRLNLFTDADLDRLADATLAVLERTGAMYQSEVILDALERAGARVDRSAQRARLPRRLVESVVERQSAARPAGTAGAPERPFWEPASPDGALPGITLQVAQFYYDHERGERRAGSRGDLVRIARFGDALDERAQGQFDAVMARYRPPEVDRDMLAQARRVVDRARQELLGA